jgi:hypothetical protein
VRSIFLLLLLAFSCSLIAQEKSEIGTESDSAFYASQMDIKKILKNIFGSKSSHIDTIKIIQTERDFILSILPGISYNPANGLIIGVSLSASWFNGPQSTTTNSSFVSSVSYTTKKQFRLSVQNNVFFKNDDWNFQGDWRYWNYVQETYGLGTNTPDSNAENMNFQFIRFNQNALKRISGRLFGGFGYSLEYYNKISTINDSDQAIYPNINNNYSKLHDYDSTSYFSSGFVINAAVDTRDNTIYSYKGYLLQSNYYNYNTVFGSSHNWQKLYLEGRAYHNLRDFQNPYILAFWFMADLALSGKAPYMSLPSIGWDKYNATGRGYIQGRFRGSSMLYFEFSNRINLTKNGLLGIAVFANANTFSDADTGQNLLDYINPAGGIGLRIKFDSRSRTNLCIDYAVGKYKSSGIFLSLGEFF